jgi:hypothetical protein
MQPGDTLAKHETISPVALYVVVGVGIAAHC